MKSDLRDWSNLAVFLAVMRQGSTLAAASLLGLSQPTVARRIEVLEHETGLTLFERDTRGFHPTAAARTLLPRAEAVETAINAFSASAREIGLPGTIRVTAFGGNFSARAQEIFSAFSLSHPEVSFEFLPDVRVLDLKAGEADIALRLAINPPDPDLICRRISTAHWGLYGSPAYADRFGLPDSVEALRGHRFIGYRREGVPPRLHDWLTRHVAPDQIVRTYSEVDLAHAAIRAGHGLGLMNLRLVADDPAYVRCFGPIEELSLPHLLLVSPLAWARPEVKAFVRHFAPRYAALYR
ncbi:LysR family transcriptional regulator [Ruegeria marina]|uniref:DNA-binding transcriptional regulator, LysR family n=1 Tax=Ruegeria marina TaxID=639004 RepID=A0A1G6LJ51_9RHOB|nr:LysR family transcriptional regulator [Ruegeria marina]SDC43310.1 DNA-binding transcriptional regulator, LysR family [Ruegeria marina]